MKNNTSNNEDNTPRHKESSSKKSIDTAKQPEEFGGQKGPEPTRYSDWENKGRVSDF